MHRNGENVFTKLTRIEELAKKEKRLMFTSLAHLLTPEFLLENFRKLNKKASAGVDGVTMSEFRENLGGNLRELHCELKEGRYRSMDIRRVYIPKADGKQRPLGIPGVKDRVIQRAVGQIVGTIYEPYFCDFSYGFRPGRSAHDALESLRVKIDRSRVKWIVDADIKGYFDAVNHDWMMKFLRDRISDKVILRLIAKWLKAGILDNGVKIQNDKGTPQGGPISPLLANIYLHYVLDLWYEKRFKKVCRGVTNLIRYADDFVVCFEHRCEAEKFLREVKERFKGFGLELSNEKTRLVEFGRYSSGNGKLGPHEQPRTFDFLGFTHYMRKKSRGYYVTRKPSRKSRNKFLRNIKEWLEVTRHMSVYVQAYGLKRRLNGYYNYFGLRMCKPALRHVKWHVQRLWVSSLRRRSQRHKLHWWQVHRKPWFNLLPDPHFR